MRTTGREGLFKNHHLSCVLRRGLRFEPTAPSGGTGDQYPLPRAHGAHGGATRCVTPRQTCPRPDGFGRNLRSKTRWFTGFCNSHQVSHLATFFIDARAEISVVESRFVFSPRGDTEPGARARERGDAGPKRPRVFRIPWRISRRGSLLSDVERGVGRPTPEGRTRSCQKDVFAGRSAFRAGFDNDPSAGSPTETLLRLLLPLNDKVQWTSRDVAGGEPPTSPRSEHFTGPFNR